MKNIILFLFSSISLFAQKTDLKNGDLLFININCGEMCDAINAVTDGYKGNDFNHMGMVVLDNHKNIFVYEAIGNAVVKTPLKTFLAYTQKEIYIGTLKKKFLHLIPQALKFCETQLGVPYDDDFIYNNGKYYCSELIYDAFLQANNKEAFFQLEPMTYKEPGSNDYFPVWINHFNERKIEIPENKLGCNPGGMSKNRNINLKKFKKNS